MGFLLSMLFISVAYVVYLFIERDREIHEEAGTQAYWRNYYSNRTKSLRRERFELNTQITELKAELALAGLLNIGYKSSNEKLKQKLKGPKKKKAKKS